MFHRRLDTRFVSIVQGEDAVDIEIDAKLSFYGRLGVTFDQVAGAEGSIILISKVFAGSPGIMIFKIILPTKIMPHFFLLPCIFVGRSSAFHLVMNIDSNKSPNRCCCGAAEGRCRQIDQWCEHNWIGRGQCYGYGCRCDRGCRKNCHTAQSSCDCLIIVQGEMG